MSRPRLIGAALAAVCGAAALAVLEPPHTRAPPQVRADAALVLSGDVDYLRLERAVALIQSGAVAWLVLTGAGAGGDSAATMRSIAVEKGIPPERVLIEDQATSTRENLLLAAPLIRSHGFSVVALVTNASHMGRAERVARKVLPEVRWIVVPVPDPGPRLRIYRTRLQEWAKLAWYALHGWV